jgi:hypothetical protein
MARTRDERFQAAVPVALMATGALLFVATALRLSPWTYHFGYLTFGTGIVLQVRRFNRNPWLTAAVVLVIGIAVVAITTELMLANFERSFIEANEDR